EGTRLLTLTGAGGIGKTRVALEVAARVLEYFSDGVFFVQFAPISDQSLFAPAIAKALNVQESGGRSVLQDLLENIRTREMLLVLDNFEHLLPIGPQVSELLNVCPRLSVLVTSRAVLRLSHEHVVEVPPMASPDPSRPSPLRVTSGFEAIRFFC